MNNWTPIRWLFSDGITTIQLRVGHDGVERFAIVDRDSTLNREGEWEFEPQPSSRTKEYLENNRYSTLEEAQNHFEKYFSKIKSNL